MLLLIKNNKKGFTLIELLVVVAIISLLSSIVMASLNSARAKSDDAFVKQQLMAMRTAAELYYQTNGNYNDICNPASQIGSMFTAAWNRSSKVTSPSPTAMCVSSGATSTACVTGAGPGAACVAPITDNRWAAVVQLKYKAPTYFCVDWTGKGGEQAARGIDTNRPSPAQADADC